MALNDIILIYLQQSGRLNLNESINSNQADYNYSYFSDVVLQFRIL